MSYIRFKPKVVLSSDGFGFSATGDKYGRPINNKTAKRTILMSIGSSSRTSTDNDFVYFYHMQKWRSKTLVEPVLTKTGKPSKKPPKITKIPTHWSYEVVSIPKAVVEILKNSGKKIIQHKHHWEIV